MKSRHVDPSNRYVTLTPRIVAYQLLLLVHLVGAVSGKLARLEFFFLITQPDAARAARYRARHCRRNACKDVQVSLV
jgi:hypothetical protein